MAHARFHFPAPECSLIYSHYNSVSTSHFLSLADSSRRSVQATSDVYPLWVFVSVISVYGIAAFTHREKVFALAADKLRLTLPET